MKKFLFSLLATFIFATSFASVQPIKIKIETTIEQSIEAYFNALSNACKQDTEAGKLAALSTTLGIPNPLSFNDAQLEEKVEEFIASKIGDFRCKVVATAAYFFYLNCAGSCLPIPYQGACAINCANNYLSSMINAQCLEFL